MPVLENIFSWSKSRAEQFEECRRKYYYDRYVSWGGWDASAPKDSRLAYILKNLKNRWAWKGETVHHVIEEALKSLRAGKPVKSEEAIAKLTQIMRQNYLASKAKKYMQEPKKSVGLYEHEYQKPIGDPVWKKIHDEAADCVQNFFSSPFYEELASEDKKNWLLIEDLEEFQFDGAKIYVKLDFARRRGDTIEIFDWKTGKEEKEATIQIGAYAMYAMKKWNVPLQNIRAYLVYLTNLVPAPKEHPLSPDLLKETEQAMTASIRGMRELLADIPKNVPKSREFFAYTENERFCSNCNFYKMCEKYYSKK